MKNLRTRVVQCCCPDIASCFLLLCRNLHAFMRTSLHSLKHLVSAHVPGVVAHFTIASKNLNQREKTSRCVSTWRASLLAVLRHHYWLFCMNVDGVDDTVFVLGLVRVENGKPQPDDIPRYCAVLVEYECGQTAKQLTIFLLFYLILLFFSTLLHPIVPAGGKVNA